MGFDEPMRHRISPCFERLELGLYPRGTRLTDAQLMQALGELERFLRESGAPGYLLRLHHRMLFVKLSEDHLSGLTHLEYPKIVRL